MGKWQLSTRSTVLRRVGGHCAHTPSGDKDQSCPRMSPDVTLVPTGQERGRGEGSGGRLRAINEEPESSGNQHQLNLTLRRLCLRPYRNLAVANPQSGARLSFLVNPDLPRRLQLGAAPNQPAPTTFYGGDAAGYTTYPALTELRFSLG